MPDKKKTLLVCESVQRLQVVMCALLGDIEGIEVVSCPNMDDVLDYLMIDRPPHGLLLSEHSLFGPKTKFLNQDSFVRGGRSGGLDFLLHLHEIGKLPPKVFLTSARPIDAEYRMGDRTRMISLIGGPSYYREIPTEGIVPWIRAELDV